MVDPAATYQPDTDAGKVRLLINDVDRNNPVFSDIEIDAFLALAGGVVRLAAADAIDTIADNEVLCSKVIRTQDLQTDGAKVADSLRKRAQDLRAQYELEDDGHFEIVDEIDCRPELTGFY